MKKTTEEIAFEMKQQFAHALDFQVNRDELLVNKIANSLKLNIERRLDNGRYRVIHPQVATIVIFAPRLARYPHPKVIQDFVNEVLDPKLKVYISPRTTIGLFCTIDITINGG